MNQNLIGEELELNLMGILLFEPDERFNIEFLKPHHFYYPHHKDIYKELCGMIDAGEEPDSLLIEDRLKTDDESYNIRIRGTLHIVGGYTSFSNVASKAYILVEMWQAREALKNADRLSIEKSEEAKDKINELRTSLDKILEDEVATEAPISDDLMEHGKHLNKLMHGEIEYIPRASHDLQKRMGGWVPGTLTTIAARPSMGKTAYILNEITHISKDHTALLFSTEMSRSMITDRLLANFARVDGKKITQGRLSKEEFERLVEKGYPAVNELNLIVDDRTRYFEDIVTKMRKYRGKVNIVFIDLLTKLQTREKFNQKTLEIEFMTAGFKDLAKQLNIPIVLVHQISRQSENRGTSKRPMLADLKHSGAIEEDSDDVLFLYRPEYYDIKTFENGNPTDNVCEVMIEKFRAGERGVCEYLQTELQYGIFRDLAKGVDDESAPF